MKSMKKSGFKPVISIVTPVWNESTKTVKCFQSIRANTRVPYELIWIDNGSKQEEFSIVRRQATKPRVHCKLIKNKNNLGFVKATNQGIQEAVGKYIILLNNDTEVTWGWDMQLLKPFQQNDRIGAVGPIGSSNVGWQGCSNVDRRWKLGLPAYKKNPQEYAAELAQRFNYRYIEVGGRKLPLSFYCCCLPKKVFDEVGVLSEDFGIGLGDDDHFAIKLWAHGYKQFLSLGGFVMHHHRTTFKALNYSVDSIRRHNVQVLKRKIKECEILKKELDKKKRDEEKNSIIEI